MLGRRGQVIGERYHMRVIRTPQQAHRARDACPSLTIGVHPPRSRLLSYEWRAYGPLDPAIVPGPFEDRSLASELF